MICKTRPAVFAILGWGFIIFLLPMALDGTTHSLSDLAGIGNGFRDSNVWLVFLSQSRFSLNFYAGDAWGSFNAWMRLLTGVFFGLGIAWFGFPYLDKAFSGIHDSLDIKLERVKLPHQTLPS